MRIHKKCGGRDVHLGLHYEDEWMDCMDGHRNLHHDGGLVDD